MRGVCLAAAAAIVMAAANSWGAVNLNSSKSNVNRDYPKAAIATASATVGGPSVSQILYTTPEKGDFILTQFCASPDANGGIRLDVTGLGSIAQTGAVSCFTFSPGISIPRSAVVSCSTTAAASEGTYFCMISGMQTSK
jgi:hypothetical protein